MYEQEITSGAMLTLAQIYLIAMFGMFINYFKRWLRRETDDTLSKYLFAGKAWKSTVNASLAVLGSCFALFASGQIGVSTFPEVITAFTVGYTCNSMFNIDSRQARANNKIGGIK